MLGRRIQRGHRVKRKQDKSLTIKLPDKRLDGQKNKQRDGRELEAAIDR